MNVRMTAMVLAAIGTVVVWQPAIGSKDERGGDGEFVARVFEDDAGEHSYTVFVPGDYTQQRAWPVILFLHGAGERGTDGERQVEVGLGPAIRWRDERGGFPFLAVFPQCEAVDVPPPTGWLADSPDGQRAMAILEEVEQAYNIDPDRVYLTGLSMGGFGTWSLAHAHPDRWAAIVPICGGGEPEWAAEISHIPTWCFHGAEDRLVPAERSREMIAALEAAGGAPRYTEFPYVDHNSWDPAYATGELYGWLLEQRRGGR